MANGQCQCGNVRISTTGKPENVRICHCRHCQKSTGAPFFARALFKQEKFRVFGQINTYPSSNQINRVYCPTCGTSLGAWRTNGTFAGIALAIFDDPHTFTPHEHVWFSEKMEWLEVSDDLPKYPNGKP